MTAAPLRLKQPTGWFAAGREVAQALRLLSDGAFKLFMWICLNADRGLGAIRIEPGEVARVLGKTEDEIQANLRDLFQAAVGQPTADGAIQIADRYWPYERAPTGRKAENLATYIDQLKRAFLERRCVRSVFTAADEKIAIDLFHAGVSITDVEHAILLGSLRKYVALTNNGRGTPITSLRYFAALYDEVKQDISPGYWVYVERRVRDAERQWPGFESTPNSDEIRITK
jgi:hypothetical protein